MMNSDDSQELPEKSDKCAVIIPTHKRIYSESEALCIRRALSILCNWDIFYVTNPINSAQPLHDDAKSVRSSLFTDEFFQSVQNYSDWLLTDSLYKRFGLFNKILIVQSDAWIVEDQINYWVDKDYDYIGAPWHGMVSVKPNFRSTPRMKGYEFKMFVGNGGLSMRDTHGIRKALLRNSALLTEFNGNEDGVFSFMGLVDPLFKIAPYHDACLFSLELLAAETILKTGKIPMGFHALEKNDAALWRLAINPDFGASD